MYFLIFETHLVFFFFFFSSRRRHTRLQGDWSSDVCSSDLCLENRVFAVTCNRTGSEARGGKDQLTYIGNSEVVTPRGAILHRAPRDQEEQIGRASCRERV